MAQGQLAAIDKHKNGGEEFNSITKEVIKKIYKNATVFLLKDSFGRLNPIRTQTTHFPKRLSA